MGEGMLNAISLFSGIGGFELGLNGYTRTVLYCEADKHAQAVLLSRMAEGQIDCAPICTDVREITAGFIDIPIDIIFGGFPCQDISVAGKGVGLEGERSGLFFEIVRLAEEIKPTFLFLENVAAIRTRGLDRVIEELTEVGYDCRWCMLSAADVGANHKRERWFLLAHSQSSGDRGRLRDLFEKDASIEQPEKQYEHTTREFSTTSKEPTILAYSELEGYSVGVQSRPTSSKGNDRRGKEDSERATKSHLGLLDDGIPSSVVEGFPEYLSPNYWQEEPDTPRVTEEKEQRVERIKRLGNAVVPLQVRTAFEYLMGVKRV